MYGISVPHFSLSAAEELRLVFAVGEIAVNIRPELLHLETDDVPTNLCRPDVDAASQCPRAGMIRIGDGCGHATTKDFREVELSFSRVRARDCSPHSRIPETVEKTPFSQLVVAWILSQHRREYGLCHVVLDGVVAKLQGVAFALSLWPKVGFALVA